MINLAMVYGGLPVVFVRHNPDKARVTKQVKEAALKETIERVLAVTPDRLVSVEYLFYDAERVAAQTEIMTTLLRNY